MCVHSAGMCVHACCNRVVQQALGPALGVLLMGDACVRLCASVHVHVFPNIRSCCCTPQVRPHSHTPPEALISSTMSYWDKPDTA